MKTTLLLILLLMVNSIGQTITEETDEAREIQVKVDQVIRKSGVRFNEGLNALQDKRRDLARESFDKSIEEFLLSDIDVQMSLDLRLCYNELVETIYRMEFPSRKQPVNIRRLSTICQWGISNEKAEKVAKLVIPVKTRVNDSLIESVANGDSNKMETQAGFSKQEFEVSPLDKLSKLELPRRKRLRLKQYGVGKKPKILKNGRYKVVVSYIYDTYNDPYSVKYLEWSKPQLVSINNRKYWRISLKHRAKNLYNAYFLMTRYFYVRDGKVVFSSEGRRGSIASEVIKPKLVVSGIRIVRAKSGDTIRTLANRYGVNPSDVAKLNGLLVSSILNAGREIRIPIKKATDRPVDKPKGIY